VAVCSVCLFPRRAKFSQSSLTLCVILCCLAEDSVQIANDEVYSNQQASDDRAQHADGVISPQIEPTSDVEVKVTPAEDDEVTAAEDLVKHDIHEAGNPTTGTPEPCLSEEIELADGVGPDSLHQSGQADVLIVHDSSGDNAGQQIGTPQTQCSETPVEEDARFSASNTGGEAELVVEEDRSGTSKSGDSVRAEVQFDDDQVLLERDGKFRMVNTDDVMAEDDVRSRSSSTSSDAALRVSSLSAKTSSGGTRGRMSGQRSAAPVPRSKSAAAGLAPRRRSADYNTTHRLTEEQKRQLERQQATRAERARQEEEEKREKEERKRQQCDDAFQAWLRRKRVEAAQRRRERIQELREEREKNNKNKVIIRICYVLCVYISRFLVCFCAAFMRSNKR